jgi:alcohol dehydrogenase
LFHWVTKTTGGVRVTDVWDTQEDYEGFAQEKINLPARLLVPAPPGVDATAAAVVPVTFGTVEHMLFDNARLEPGETILVHAGGSGIGSAAIQLAKRIGCMVITTVGSADKIDRARALGADHVINYREERFEGVVRKITRKKGVDVVFEHVGADTWAGSMLSLKRGGRLVTCGSTSGVSTQMNLMQLFQQQLRLIGSFGCRMENMANALAKMAAGHVAPVIDTEVGFDDIGKALARMEGRDVFGKIILKVT